MPSIIRSSKTVIAAFGLTYVYVKPKTYVKPEAAITVFELLMIGCVSSKHVEQLRNIGIIDSTKRLHLVGSFYEI
jgi:hypothetical protein